MQVKKKTMLKEHVELVKFLKNPTEKKRKTELKEQTEELSKIKKKVK